MLIASAIHTSTACSALATASLALRATLRSSLSPATRAQMSRAATTAPQNACVWVAARWTALGTTAQASAARAIVDDGAPVMTTSGCGQSSDSVIPTMSRSSPDEDTTSRASPGNQRNSPDARIPAGTAMSDGAEADVLIVVSHSASAA